jgi:uncharacterized integral membrane protein
MTGFSPLRKASHFKLALVALVGPLIWVVVLVFVAFASQRGDAVGFALLVAGASCGLSVAVLGAQRLLRVRREGKGPP